MADGGRRIFAVACGIMAEDVRASLARLRVESELESLDSSLHMQPDELSSRLSSALDAHRGEAAIVAYGCCHPMIDRMLAPRRVARVECQNCVDLLIGKEAFDSLIRRGAFFLLDDWIARFEEIVLAFSGDYGIGKEILSTSHRLLVAIEGPERLGPASLARAREISSELALPLEFAPVNLASLDARTLAAVKAARAMAEAGG
jgi:hypothetical protein